MQKGNVFALGLLAILCISQALMAENNRLTVQRMSLMPLSFTQNSGQWDDQVSFRANAGGATFWFTKEKVYYQFTRRIPRLSPSWDKQECLSYQSQPVLP